MVFYCRKLFNFLKARLKQLTAKQWMGNTFTQSRSRVDQPTKHVKQINLCVLLLQKQRI